MAKVVIEKWQCDRCGKIEEAKPKPLAETFSVRVCHELEWAGGIMFEWKEICHECNSEVESEVRQMIERADVARLRTRRGDHG